MPEDKMLNFEEFQQYVVGHIMGYLPDSVDESSIALNTLKKNNGTELPSIIIREKGKNISPTIYLGPYYESYINGMTMDDVLEHLAKTFKASDTTEYEDIGRLILDPEYVRTKTIVCAVNAEANEKLLKEVPYTRVEDLALIYKILLPSSERGLYTITIKNAHMAAWGFDTATIHEFAMANSKEQLPIKIQTMEEVMEEIYGRHIDDMGVPMYVVTNDHKINGAAALLYDHEAFERYTGGQDMIILPSSVHEIIAVPADSGTALEYAKMVREINASEVAEEERLSDHVYLYNAKEHTLTIADEPHEMERQTASEAPQQEAPEVQETVTARVQPRMRAHR